MLISKQAVKVMIEVELFRESKRLEKNAAANVEFLLKDRMVQRV